MMGPPGTRTGSWGTSMTVRVNAPKWSCSRRLRSGSAVRAGAVRTVTARSTTSCWPVARSASMSQAADQLVIVSTVREDTAQSAAWLIDALRATGQEDAVKRAVTVLTAPASTADPELSRRLHDHFGALTRTVMDVPHDPMLVPGGPIIYDALSAQTRKAWLSVSAVVANGL